MQIDEWHRRHMWRDVGYTVWVCYFAVLDKLRDLLLRVRQWR